MKNVLGVILAGGKGTRLEPLTPAAPVLDLPDCPSVLDT